MIGWPEPADPCTAPAPLHGTRVLDLSRVLAGPLATMQLADLGATVLKVEDPKAGDVTRAWPPFLPDGTSTYYCAINRNKRSVAADLATADGRDLVAVLAAGADVIVHNFLPGRLERFGVHLADLRAARPALVTAAVSGYGSDSPLADQPGFDFLAQAMGAVMAITGQAGGPPTRMGVAVVDIIAGQQLTQGILAALYEVARGGPGRDIEVALLDAAAFSLMNLASTHLLTGAKIVRFGNAHPSIAPYETLRTADGEIAVAVGTDRQFARFATALQRPFLASDPLFATNADRVRNRPRLRLALEEALGRHTCEYWLTSLANQGIPIAPVNEVDDLFTDPELRARLVDEVQGVRQVRNPLRIDGHALPMHLPPPRLGEHTDETLARVASTGRGSRTDEATP